MLTDTEKFMLFVATFAAAMQVRLTSANLLLAKAFAAKELLPVSEGGIVASQALKFVERIGASR